MGTDVEKSAEFRVQSAERGGGALGRANQEWGEMNHGWARLGLNHDRDPDRKINDLEKELTTEDSESTSAFAAWRTTA